MTDNSLATEKDNIEEQSQDEVLVVATPETSVSSVDTYSPQLKDDPKEPTRQFIVYFLLAIMAGLLLLPFAMTAFLGCKDTAKECKDIMTKELWEFVHIAFPALTGLLGTAIGFYFERNSK